MLHRRRHQNQARANRFEYQAPQQNQQLFHQQQLIADPANAPPQPPDRFNQYQIPQVPIQQPPIYQRLEDPNYVQFPQLHTVDREFQQYPNHHRLTNKDQFNRFLVKQSNVLQPWEEAAHRRVTLAATAPETRTELDSIKYIATKVSHFDQNTGRTIKKPSNYSFEDNLLAYAKNPKLQQELKENTFTKAQKHLLTRLQFRSDKNQSVESLSRTALEAIVHGFGAKIISLDVIHRILLEYLPELKTIMKPDHINILAAARDAHKQIDTVAYAGIAYEQDPFLYQKLQEHKNNFRIKRTLTFASTDNPVLANLANFKLKTAKKPVNNPSQSVSIAPVAPHPHKKRKIEISPNLIPEIVNSG